MKTYLYEFDASKGIKLSQVSIEYFCDRDCYDLKVVTGNRQAIVDVYPEELVEINDGVCNENIKHRIRCAIYRMSGP